jgi:phage terminase Nu1 subunit (DNA packaging protein)
MKLTRAEVADLLGIAHTTVDARVRRGMPYEQRGERGKAWVFDSAAVIAWEREQAVKNAVGDTNQADEAELKRRKLAAETTVAEIEAAKARGLVAELDVIEREWSSAFAEFAARVMQVPSRAAPQLLGLDAEREIKAVLKDELEEALKTLGDRCDDDSSAGA